MALTFELYEDAAGERRLRLRHDDGDVTADSGEGSAPRSGGRGAVERVRASVPEADVLDAPPAASEVCDDRSGSWRWRLRHRNGNVPADGGEGSSSRPAVRDAVASVGGSVADADEAELDGGAA